MSSIWAEEVTSNTNDDTQTEQRPADPESRDLPPSLFHSNSSGVPDDLNSVTMVPEVYDDNDVVMDSIAAEVAAALCRFNCDRGSTRLRLASQEEAQRYLRYARIALLHQIGFAHPLSFRTRLDGSLGADEEFSGSFESRPGEGADTRVAFDVLPLRAGRRNADNDATKDCPNEDDSEKINSVPDQRDSWECSDSDDESESTESAISAGESNAEHDARAQLEPNDFVDRADLRQSVLDGSDLDDWDKEDELSPLKRMESLVDSS